MIEITYLVGSSEPFEETLRHFFSTKWDPTKTNNITPVFLSPNGIDSQAADLTQEVSQTDISSKKASGLITFESTEEIPLDAPSNLSTTFETPIKITVYARSKYEMSLFQRHINDIIQENMPNGNLRIKKSNGTEDSAIAYFKNRKGIRFNRPPLTEKDGYVYLSSGTISCMWIKTKTS